MPSTVPDFVWWVFVSVVGISGFLGIYVLTQISRNQTELFNSRNNHEKRISTIEGRCEAIMDLGGHK